MATSCRVAAGDVSVTEAARPTSDAGLPSAAPGQDLPVLGPVPGSSHWHAAYIVRICDDVLAPFDSSDDPLGIHSHGDGVMHVHPFFEQSGYEAATLGLFADAMGMVLSEGELRLPGGGTWRDGDLCGDIPGRVFVDRWREPDPESPVERIFADPQDVRYLADGELYQIAFAPVDSPPVVPPSTPLLHELSNLGAGSVEPWVDVDPTATLLQVHVWPVASVSEPPCAHGQSLERVRVGPAACFTPDEPVLSGPQAIRAARAVRLNRRPAVELTITTQLRRLIQDHFVLTDQPLALAVEIDGHVVTAPVLERLPVSEDRLVIAGGFSDESARKLAAVLNG